MRTLFLDTFKKEKVAQPPLWIMRQAGRYLPEYRKVRANFENFMDMCRNADACCEVALQPLRRYDLDAAIVFSDILTIPEAMGMDLKFVKGKGPIFSSPLQQAKDINALLATYDAMAELTYVADAVKTTKSAINVPLIGFTGSPWTLAAYMIEGQGSKQFNKLRKFMYSEPMLMHRLLQKVSDVIIEYLLMQVRAGADSLMIFDTWGGILPANKYKEFSLEYMEYIANKVKQSIDIPVVFFTKGGSNFFKQYSSTNCNGVGIDWSVDIAEARSRLNDGLVIQGNFDPALLYASDSEIIVQVKSTMKFIQDDKRNNYIVNLGHGVYPDISPDKVKVLVEAVREYS